jgi:hypothetical protein
LYWKTVGELAERPSHRHDNERTFERIASSLGKEAFLLTRIRNVLWEVSDQSLSAAADGANPECPMLSGHFIAEIGVVVVRVGVALVRSVVHGILRTTTRHDAIVFPVLLLLCRSWRDRSVGTWCRSSSRCGSVGCSVSWRSRTTCINVCCNRVEQVVDLEHVGVGGLRSQLARETITAVALRSAGWRRCPLGCGRMGHGVTSRDE